VRLPEAMVAVGVVEPDLTEVNVGIYSYSGRAKEKWVKHYYYFDIQQQCNIYN